MTRITGTVLSHTVIRMPGKAHAADAPFMLLLVRMDGGANILGHFADRDPPQIGARVSAEATESETPVFRKS